MGKASANEKELERRRKISIANSGKKNGMYGKPSPTKGKKASKEKLEKQSISMKKYYNENLNTTTGFQKDHKCFSGCEKGWFAEGQIPWNKDTTGLMPTPWNKNLSNEELKQHYINGLPVPPHYSGEEHWNWQNGKSFEKYGTEFNKKLKEKIKKRDNYQCQSCNFQNKLVIHHIDYNKLNNVENNLISLCRPCHGKVHQGGLKI